METSSLTELLNTEFIELSERDLNYMDSEDDLLTFFYNGINDIDSRVRVLYEIQKKDLDLFIETTNKVLTQFNFMFSTINYNLICGIIKHNKIDINLRINAIESVYNHDKNKAWYFYNELTNEDTFITLSYPIKLGCLKFLLETDTFYKETLSKLNDLLTNKTYECEYRYKSLFKLAKEKNDDLYKRYMYDIHILFIKNTTVYTQYKILASQYILQNFNKNEEILQLLSTFALDEQLDYNLRADASDMLVRFGVDKYKEIGKDIITLLGKESNKLKTVYNNRQNVHSNEIDNSVRRIILEIAGMKTVENNMGKLITFNEIVELIKQGYKGDDKDKLNSSLLRIELDQTIYDGGQTLSSIFIKIYNIILSHPHKDDLYNRLIEELIDMADTCSSGHLSRLINILSGYEIDGKLYTLEISYKDQIKSNLIARLISRIKEDKYYHKCELCDTISNYNYEKDRRPIRCSVHKEKDMINYNYIKEDTIETIREKILEDLSTSESIQNKVYISYFFRLHLLDIRDELYNEFVPKYLSEELFEEYIRSSICEFEGEN